MASNTVAIHPAAQAGSASHPEASLVDESGQPLRAISASAKLLEMGIGRIAAQHVKAGLDQILDSNRRAYMTLILVNLNNSKLLQLLETQKGRKSREATLKMQGEVNRLIPGGATRKPNTAARVAGEFRDAIKAAKLLLDRVPHLGGLAKLVDDLNNLEMIPQKDSRLDILSDAVMKCANLSGEISKNHGEACRTAVNKALKAINAIVSADSFQGSNAFKPFALGNHKQK
ncbi:hypothetical protein HK101_001227 [Irineochytrium annulatum]|nr:hypothetical protein HK101_001227 [Irineochytrium annulatum]